MVTSSQDRRATYQPRLARDIMVRDLVTLKPRMHVCDGIAHLLRYKISGAPVIDQQGKFLGVFSEKCCMSVLALAARLATDARGIHAHGLRAADFMVTKLVTLTPDMDVVEVIGQLLKHHISGAPVVDQAGQFLGVLSERYSMSVLIDAAYDQLPTSGARSYMNTDFGRVISGGASLAEVSDIFRRTHYRRLVVLRDGKLQGQISRRDVLRAGQHLPDVFRKSAQSLLDGSDRIVLGDDRVEAAQGRLPSPEIDALMDTQARTISEETDLLSIARIFLGTNHRRLPVLDGERLVGQVSRRDVLQAIYDLLAVAPKRETTLLYLSSLVNRQDSPIPQ